VKDLTILYYTANKISDHFSESVKSHLIESSRGEIPIISISHKPIDFGKNICVGDIGASSYNVYKQILIGAKEAKTRYVVCCEDDCLYNYEHFNYRPRRGTFTYNKNRWFVEYYDKRHIFRWRNRSGMFACIVETYKMIEALETRFKKFPDPLFKREDLRGWGEPGRYEKVLGLPRLKIEYFKTNDPILTFNHKPSLGGIRRVNPDDIIVEELPQWGKAYELWEKIHGRD
jgi:hypothetical protein